MLCNQKFLDLYKELEDLLRKQNNKQTILQYEEILQKNDADKLRICRQMRNYIQHHEDGNRFLVCSEEMCKFIQELINNEKGTKEIRIRRLEPLHNYDRIGDVKTFFSKTNKMWMPIVDENNNYLGTLDILQLIHIYSNQSPNKKLSSIMNDDDYDKTSIPVLNNKEDVLNFEGTEAVVIGKNGKYIGILP